MKDYLRLISLSLIVQILIPSLSIAGIYEYQYTPPDSIDPDGFAHYKIFIPDNVNTVKGIYCYIPGIDGTSLDIVNNSYYQEYVEEKKMALMGFKMLGKYTDYYSGVTLWSGEALIDALKELSILSGHIEIENSALFFDGYSAGGQFSYHFTQWKPERVIAFVTVKGGGHSLSAAGDAIKVPGYMFIGENDEDYRINNLTFIFETYRPVGALWSLAMEPDAGHSHVSNVIIQSFFDQIIPMRMPETIPLDTIPQLVEIDEETGWLGDRNTLEINSYSNFTGDKYKACWFPNEKIANEWKEFVMTNIDDYNQIFPEYPMLYQNYPNPFNPITTITYHLPVASKVELIIYNILGQKVATLIDKKQQAGKHIVQFNASDLASGIYIYILKTGSFEQSHKMVLIR